MKRSHPRIPKPDPAAIFGAALSIWTACHEMEGKEATLDLSDTFNGLDELMRVAMAIATRFETWSCHNVEFDRLSGWWPYKLEMELGKTCLELLGLEALPKFGDDDALQVALRLQLPLKPGAKRWIPLHVHAANPIPGATFTGLYIRTMREAKDGSGVYPFTEKDEPFDPNFGVPFYGIYGIDSSGMSEHITDRSTRSDAIAIVEKLLPGIHFK
jgi:hypothetical protein